MKVIIFVLFLPWFSSAFTAAPRARLDRVLVSLHESDESKRGTVAGDRTLRYNYEEDTIDVKYFHQHKKILSGAGTEESPSNPTPAEYERPKFQCDESVEFWRDYNIEGNYDAQDFAREISSVSNRFLGKGGKALSYWLRHTARSGYFTVNALLGMAAINFQQPQGDASSEKRVNPDKVLQPLAVTYLLAEAALSYEQDYKQIEMGRFRLPYDMYTRNRQNSPLFWMQQSGRLVREFTLINTRNERRSEEDKNIWIRKNYDGIYPEYYKNTFHYQTDGWMSPESANVYETSTETLFLGRQDAMQRTALAPLVDFAKKANEKQLFIKRPLKVLEVACGTGRFMTFARDNLPLDTEYTALDLSPFYLEKARDNDKNWRSIRKRADGLKKSIEPATFVQAKAEDLPFQDEEFDIVLCMYLYHEVPRSIRSKISSEMARVTKKGGNVIFTDSNQKGDRPVADEGMGNFGNLNEPYYRDYIEDYISDHFENAGLECLTKLICSSTKTLTFGKPASSLRP